NTHAVLLTPRTSTTTTTLSSTTTTAQTTATTTTSTSMSSSTSTTVPCMTARCTLDKALSGVECRDQTVPITITKKLDHAAGLVGDAASNPPKRAGRLRQRVKTLLTRAAKAAGTAATGKSPKLTAGCAAAIKHAADVVRDGLGV